MMAGALKPGRSEPRLSAEAQLREVGIPLVMGIAALVEVSPDFPHFREGHGLIGFVIQVQSRAIVGLVAEKPSK